MVGIKDFEMPNYCRNCQLNSCAVFSKYLYCNITGRDVDIESKERPSDCPLVEVIPKDNVYKAIQEMMNYEHERSINISLAKLSEILEKCGVWDI